MTEVGGTTTMLGPDEHRAGRNLRAAGRAAAHAEVLIAGYKAPRSCEFAGSLPLSAAGKILKRELRKPYWDSTDRGVH